MSTLESNPHFLHGLRPGLGSTLDYRDSESRNKGGQIKRVVLSLLVAGAVLGLNATSAIAAASTTTTIESVNVSYSETNTCGFELDWHIQGEDKVVSFFDTSGTLVKSILTATGGPFTVTVTNPASSKTATTQSQTSIVIVTFNPDGSINTITENGLVFNFVLPGTGTIALDVGSVVFDSAFNILRIGGPHQLETGDTAGFCAALS
jgi:hypothetical protein